MMIKPQHKFALYLLLYLALSSIAFAQVVDIPDPNLRAAIREFLNLPADTPITQAEMLRLTKLEADKRGVSDLTGLEFATELRSLEIHDNDVIDLTPIAGLRKLEYLSMWGFYLSDLSPLANLVALRELHAPGCQIADISPLANLKQLTILNLRNNRIVDVRPLAGLTNLKALDIEGNLIVDHSPLDSLSLREFVYDQFCEMPPLPLEPRLENRTYPSTFGGQWMFGHDSRIDLMYGGSYLGMGFRRDGKLSGTLDYPLHERNKLIAMNPNMVFLVEIRWASDKLHAYSEDWPYWLRDSNGKIIIDDNRNPKNPRVFINFMHPGAQDVIVQKAVDISKCGLFDGIVFDSWGEHVPLLPHHLYSLDEGELSKINEAQQQVKLDIVRRVRAATRPNFLIQVNSNRSKIPLTGPYINGLSMETVIPFAFFHDPEALQQALMKTESTLLWAEENLREPHINGVAGQGISTEAADSAFNRRWVRVITTLSLTHADGYALYQTEYGNWYDFLETDLGYPVGDTAQLYQETEGLFIREFTNGWAAYNRSGSEQELVLPEPVTGVSSRLEGLSHTLPNFDGEMYLKKTTPVDTPDVNGSDIYIAQPIDAVPGAVLLLDASNNPGAIAHWVNLSTAWVNLGTAGGSLLASDRLPTVEEGEIEIPAIGFSGRRRYYTATSSGQTFGGPVQANPQLYLGDWALEFLCKRNGDLFFGEHHFAGFQNSPREGLQGLRLGLLLNGQELDMSIHADGVKQPPRSLNIFLEENVWTWVTIVSINGESIVAYQDGVEVSRHPGVYFDASLPINDISIGSYSYDERERNFNGSFSIVRVYDRALSPDEVLQNIGATVSPVTNPADVNGDGVVNILDLVVVAQGLGTDKPEADVNKDGVVNVFDLVQVAGALEGDGAAPSAYSLDLSMISAGDVERWLALVQGSDIGDANLQPGIRFLRQLLAVLTPKETTLLPNYPNPFNPETWIAYHLAQEAEVAITIYDTKGTLVRRLALGNQAAGHYAERGKAAYWDGRNECGEAVASGVYIYQFRAGDYVASRRVVILK